MRLSKLSLILSVLCFFPVWLSGQGTAPDTLSVRMLGHATGNAVILRWAPLDYDTWAWGNQHGYRLLRVTLKQNGQYLTSQEQQQSFVVLDSTLAPLPEADWEPLADTNDLAGLAAGAVHGQGFIVDTLAGGGLVQAYNVNREETNRFGFSLFAADQSMAVAEAMGLAYTDTNVAPNTQYAYRVEPNNPPPGAIVDRPVIRIGPGDGGSFSPPAFLRALPGDKSVQLSWERPEPDDPYTSFRVERSDDGGASFQQVNDRPVIYTTSAGPESRTLFFRDSLPANDQLYVYRVRGNTPFGLPGPPSDTVHAVGKPGPVNYTPVIADLEELSGGSVRIYWNSAGGLRSDLSRYDVYRAGSREGRYEKVNASPISPMATSFTDSDPLPVNYYVLKAVDDNGYVLASFPRLMQLRDETPPAAPTGLACVAAPNGIVRVNWAANPEEDLMGYRVFTSNQLNGTYSQVTSTWISDTAFYHQLNLETLTEEAYFKVLALDFRENQSGLSEACEVQRPDIIPPAPPNITDVEATAEGVRLAWAESSSEDVAAYELHRRKVSGYTWETLHSWAPGDISVFQDTTGSHEFEYEYRLTAEDDSGLRSNSRPVRARPLDDGLRAPVANLWVLPGHRRSGAGGDQYVIWINGNYTVSHPVAGGATVPRAAAILVWEYPAAEGLHSFLLYRAGEDGQFRAHKTVYPADALTPSGYLQEIIAGFGANTNINPGGVLDAYHYVDEDLRGGRTYQYKVMARYVNGAVSPMSDVAVIVF